MGTTTMLCSTNPTVAQMTKREVVSRPEEPGVFDVYSSKDRRYRYQVDLFELEGNGVCQCTDFQTRCWKNYKENGGVIVDYGKTKNPNKDRTYCKHIQKARFQFLNELLRQLWITTRADRTQEKALHRILG